jgi:hypothetical protein
MVQQAELKLAATVCEMCHRELASVVVAEDAHLFVEHDAVLPPLVRLEEVVKLGVGVATLEVRGKRNQSRRRRGGAAGVDQVVAGEGESIMPPRRILEGDCHLE